MDTWTVQMGYPVVQVNRDTTTNTLAVSQKYFLLNPQNKIQYTDEYDTYKWYIPFTYTTKAESNFDFETRPTWIMPENNMNNQVSIEIEQGNAIPNNWIVGNLQHAGFYRVNYDMENWNLLINQLLTEHKVLNIISKAQLLDDSFNLGKGRIY